MTLTGPAGPRWAINGQCPAAGGAAGSRALDERLGSLVIRGTRQVLNADALYGLTKQGLFVFWLDMLEV